jgi:hypothetical protein
MELVTDSKSCLQRPFCLIRNLHLHVTLGHSTSPILSTRAFIHLIYVQLVTLVSWGGVRLSQLVTSATIWPIVAAQNDR